MAAESPMTKGGERLQGIFLRPVVLLPQEVGFVFRTKSSNRLTTVLPFPLVYFSATTEGGIWLDERVSGMVLVGIIGSSSGISIPSSLLDAEKDTIVVPW